MPSPGLARPIISKIETSSAVPNTTNEAGRPHIGSLHPESVMVAGSSIVAHPIARTSREDDGELGRMWAADRRWLDDFTGIEMLEHRSSGVQAGPHRGAELGRRGQLVVSASLSLTLHRVASGGASR